MKTTKILVAEQIETGESIRIEGDEYHYLRHVRRRRHGDKIVILTKCGKHFSGTLVHFGANFAEATIEEELQRPRTTWPIHLLVAIPKQQLMDELIRRVSEIGIESLQPITTERSVVKTEKTRLARWKKIAFESQRQCSRDIPLAIEIIGDFSEAIQNKPKAAAGYLFHPTGPGFFAKKETSDPESPVFLAIGPEGGFSPREIEMASSRGFQCVGLGNSILRIETAAVAASVLAVAMLGGYS